MEGIDIFWGYDNGFAEKVIYNWILKDILLGAK